MPSTDSMCLAKVIMAIYGYLVRLSLTDRSPTPLYASTSLGVRPQPGEDQSPFILHCRLDEMNNQEKGME